MRTIRAATAQFEAYDGDKRSNLEVIESLAEEAHRQGAEIVTFHECSISGYTFLEKLQREEIEALAEPVPGGPSLSRLQEISAKLGIYIGAGLVEEEGGHLYNTYAVVGPSGMLARHRKIHAFISEHVSCGEEFTVFDCLGAKFGILICYDNNLPENVRCTAMMGADIVLMPHVTGCLPSPMPGRGTVEPEVWERRVLDPVRCRQEFDGPKGRGWLMKWLPARAFENGVFAIYSNPIGREGGTIKPGGSLILDPFGEVVSECRELGNQVITATLDAQKRELASGPNYIRARRPELYGVMAEANPHLGPDKKPEVWWKKKAQAQSVES
jgi:predicted amidohydrolase